MTSQRVFETESIDLISCLATAGHEAAVIDSGTSLLPAKRLLNACSLLFQVSSREVQL